MNTLRNSRTTTDCSERSTNSFTFFVKYDGKNTEFIDAKSRVVKCGEIWMASLPAQDGSIQGGHRPVFIISNDMNNKYSSVLNVIPFTTKMNKRNLPCHVEIFDYHRYGLTAPSTLLVEQLTTIRKEDLRYFMGEIRDVSMLTSICSAMRSQFPIMSH